MPPAATAADVAEGHKIAVLESGPPNTLAQKCTVTGTQYACREEGSFDLHQLEVPAAMKWPESCSANPFAASVNARGAIRSRGRPGEADDWPGSRC